MSNLKDYDFIVGFTLFTPEKIRYGKSIYKEFHKSEKGE